MSKETKILKNTMLYITKKDIEKERITVEKLKYIIMEIFNDKTWYDVDFEDTINKILNKETEGIVYQKYKDVSNLEKQVYLSNENNKGEYTDLYSENIDFYKNKGYDILSVNTLDKLFKISNKLENDKLNNTPSLSKSPTL